ncbi:hypothetical protein GW17_00006366 [Ensete ventricosum]|nr:hypothetical protein GW17_00006366 [Ensete ventricosum]
MLLRIGSRIMGGKSNKGKNKGRALNSNPVSSSESQSKPLVPLTSLNDGSEAANVSNGNANGVEEARNKSPAADGSAGDKAQNSDAPATTTNPAEGELHLYPVPVKALSGEKLELQVIDMPFRLHHKRDPARAEDALALSFGTELIGMQRDWNEELHNKLPGATGNSGLCMLTNSDKEQKQDVSDLTTDASAEAQITDSEQATYASANNDLKGTKAYQEADVPGLYNLAMAIIDYRGHRVVAQVILETLLFY